jgi:hypothetical protein
MKTRRPIIPQRRVIFVGCEGDSEAAYAGLLQDFATNAGLHIHLSIAPLAPGAGDPLDRVEMAVRRIVYLRKTRIAPEERFVLLDRDQADRDPARGLRAQQIADQNDIHILWQRPCFEAVLLRHLPGRAANRPPQTQDAQAALRNEWAQYRKPMSRSDLAKRISLEDVLRAATVEPDLERLLRCLGLIADEE